MLATREAAANVLIRQDFSIKGTGWDKIAISCEMFQLPAPKMVKTIIKRRDTMILTRCFFSEIKYATAMASKMPAKIKKVQEVPTVGIVIKVGAKVPMMEPIVLRAFSSPTIFPLSSKLAIEYLTREGETVPSSISGKTNRAIQEKRDAHMRKFDPTKPASKREIPAMTYLPSSGMAATQMATTMIRE